jgi:acetyl-CoA decarbonylase/synthase complex subunit beta
MRSPKFLQVDDGWNRVVWLPESIKERVYDFMPEDLRDKVPTESDVMSIADLKTFLKEKNHPVAERWVEIEDEIETAVAADEAGSDYVQVPGDLTAMVGGVGGGLEIIFKNAKIYAEKVIIRRTGKGDKKK